MTEDLKLSVGKALGKIPSGVYILSAAHGGHAAAMMVSWVQQVSFEPPAVAIAMAKDRFIRTLVDAGEPFALSIVAKTDSTLMKKYARGIPHGEDPFAGMSAGQTPAGATYLADALGWLELRLLKTCDFGADHDLYIAEITAGHLLKDEPPFTHVRGNGFHY